MKGHSTTSLHSFSLDKDTVTVNIPRMNSLDSNSKLRQFVLKSSSGAASLGMKIPTACAHLGNLYIPVLNGLGWSLFSNNGSCLVELVYDALLIRSNISIDSVSEGFKTAQVEPTSLHVKAIKQQVYFIIN